MTSNPALCIFIRSDMKSMNPGKAAAQAAHRATLFERYIYTETNVAIRNLYEDWCNSTLQGFGTKLTFSIKESDFALLEELYKNDRTFENSLFGICHDPTYPLQDGNVIHYLPINTGCFMFINANDVGGKIGKFFAEKGIEKMK